MLVDLSEETLHWLQLAIWLIVHISQCNIQVVAHGYHRQELLNSKNLDTIVSSVVKGQYINPLWFYYSFITNYKLLLEKHSYRKVKYGQRPYHNSLWINLQI